MTRHPFDSDELGRSDPELDHVGEQLERYSAQARGEPPPDLSGRILAVLEQEPHPRGRIALFLAAWSAPARAIAGAAIVVLLVVGGLALGQLIERTREQIGATPSPSVTVTPSPTPSPTPTSSPTPTPSPTPSATPTPTVTPSLVPTPSASDDDEVETPRPTESDNSGPGGGGGGGSDNSGPGGGG